jgi:hypothetical protein
MWKFFQAGRGCVRNHYGGATHGLRRQQITFGVANEEGVLKDKGMLGLGVKQQTRLRFSALAVILRPVCAIVNTAYSSPLRFNLFYKVTGDFL